MKKEIIKILRSWCRPTNEPKFGNTSDSLGINSSDIQDIAIEIETKIKEQWEEKRPGTII